MQQIQTIRTRKIRGRVVPGRRLGRTLGFPTANLAVERWGDEDQQVDLQGVWLARAMIQERGACFWALVNIGTKPTVRAENNLDPNPDSDSDTLNEVCSVEAWLMEFPPQESLYGQVIVLELTDYIRPEKKFDSLEALRRALEQDRITAERLIQDSCIQTIK